MTAAPSRVALDSIWRITKILTYLQRTKGEDGNTYEKLGGNPIVMFMKALKDLVKQASDEGVLDNKEAKYLVSLGSRMPTIYCLPTTHKNLDRDPGRPIVEWAQLDTC